MRPWNALSFVSLSSLLALAACGGSDAAVSSTSSTEPAPDVSGAWTGTWLSATGAGGTLRVTLRETGDAVEGETTFTGSPCFSAGSLSGSLRGRQLSATLEAGAIRVSLEGTVTSASIDGTYGVGAAGACSNDSGTFSFHRP